MLDEACTEVEVGELTAHPAPVLGIAFSSDERIAATLGNDGQIRLWDAETGELLVSVRASGHHLAFEPEGSLLVAGPNGVVRATCDLCVGIDELLPLARERVTRSLTPDERATYLGQNT